MKGDPMFSSLPTLEATPSDRLVTVQEAARYLHVSDNTAYTLIREGKLPAVRLGRQWRVNLTAFMAQGGKREA